MKTVNEIENIRFFNEVFTTIDLREFEELFDDLKKDKYKEFIRIKLEHIIMKHPESIIQWECKKCRHIGIADGRKPIYLEELVNYFLEQTLNLSRSKLVKARKCFLSAWEKKVTILTNKFSKMSKIYNLLKEE